MKRRSVMGKLAGWCSLGLAAALFTSCAQHSGKGRVGVLASQGTVCYKLTKYSQAVLPTGLNTTHKATVKASRPSGSSIVVSPLGPYTITLTYTHSGGSPVFQFPQTYTFPTGTSYPKQVVVTVPISIPGSAYGTYTITAATAVTFSDSSTPVNATRCQ